MAGTLLSVKGMAAGGQLSGASSTPRPGASSRDSGLTYTAVSKLLVKRCMALESTDTKPRTYLKSMNNQASAGEGFLGTGKIKVAGRK